MDNERIKYIAKGILKSIIVTILFVLGLYVMKKVAELYYNARFPNDEIFYISGRLTVLPMMLIISTVILIEYTQFNRKKYIMQRKAAVAGAILGLVLGLISSTNFTKYTLDGITTYTTFGCKGYSFNDTAKYTVTSTSDGVLRIIFRMEDEKIFVFQGSKFESVCYTNQDGNAEKKYILETAKIMKEKNIPTSLLTDSQIDMYIKYEYWNNIAKEINKIFKEETLD